MQTPFLLTQTIVSNGFITGNEWSNTNNLLLTDLDVAQSNPSQTASDVIVGNFAFSIPVGATIDGIEIELIGVFSGSPTTPPITITPYFVDNTSGTNDYYPYVTPQVVTITP